ncbi:hypothetical protein SNEBB_004453 [Seison nebaliae]|nr:hypothetical protein SNEBB_004453 [Seison nebaliae]
MKSSRNKKLWFDTHRPFASIKRTLERSRRNFRLPREYHSFTNAINHVNKGKIINSTTYFTPVIKHNKSVVQSGVLSKPSLEPSKLYLLQNDDSNFNGRTIKRKLFLPTFYSHPPVIPFYQKYDHNDHVWQSQVPANYEKQPQYGYSRLQSPQRHRQQPIVHHPSIPNYYGDYYDMFHPTLPTNHLNYKLNYQYPKEFEWSEWTEWSHCPKTCRQLISKRTRHCIRKLIDSVYPKNNFRRPSSYRSYNMPYRNRRFRRSSNETLKNIDMPLSARQLKYFSRDKRTSIVSKHYCKPEKSIGDSQFKLCHPEYCPHKVFDDYRTELCKRNATGQFPEGDVTAYLDVTQQCSLYCRTKAGREFFNYGQLPDGTKCRPSNDRLNGVCINGRCRDVGCDGNLDNALRSPLKQFDVCGICEGKESTCQLFKGIATVKVLKPSYTTIFKIPPGARKIKVEELQSKRHIYLALGTNSNPNLLNENYQISLSKKFEGAGSEFMYWRRQYLGSKINSNELITSEGPLNETLFIRIVSYQPDNHVTIEYSFTMPQGTHQSEVDGNKDRFVKDSTFGINVNGKNRYVVSRKDKKSGYRRKKLNNNETAKTKKHREKFKSSVTKTLENNQMYTALPHTEKVDQWRPNTERQKQAKFIPVNKPERKIYLMHGQIIYGDPMANVPEGVRRFPNNLTPEKPQWIFHRITSCSKECGKGEKHIYYKCARPLIWETENLNEQYCMNIEKPTSVIPCNRKKCPTNWRTRLWEPCSNTCGEGIRKRKISCEYIDENGERQTAFEVIPNKKFKELENCKYSNQPETSQKCYESCNYWKTSSWSTCSVTCGKGKRFRDVVCKSDTGSIVDDSYCSLIKKPKIVSDCVDLPDCYREWYYAVGLGHKRISSKISGIDIHAKTSELSCDANIEENMIYCEPDSPELMKVIRKSYAGRQPIDLSTLPSPLLNEYQKRPCQIAELKNALASNKYQEIKESAGILRFFIPHYINRKILGNKKCFDTMGTRPVMQWFTGEWSECSNNCGKGIRIREVRCTAVDMKSMFEKMSKKFSNDILLHNQNDEWKYAEIIHQADDTKFQKINEQIQQRKKRNANEVLEIHGNGEDTEEEILCNKLIKPKNVEECDEYDEFICDNVAWFHTQWSKCKAKSCNDEGVMVRKRICLFVRNGTLTNDKRCFESSNNLLPETEKICRLPCEIRSAIPESITENLPLKTTLTTMTTEIEMPNESTEIVRVHEEEEVELHEPSQKNNQTFPNEHSMDYELHHYQSNDNEELPEVNRKFNLSDNQIVNESSLDMTSSDNALSESYSDNVATESLSIDDNTLEPPTKIIIESSMPQYQDNDYLNDSDYPDNSFDENWNRE